MAKPSPDHQLPTPRRLPSALRRPMVRSFLDRQMITRVCCISKAVNNFGGQQTRSLRFAAIVRRRTHCHRRLSKQTRQACGGAAKTLPASPAAACSAAELSASGMSAGRVGAGSHAVTSESLPLRSAPLVRALHRLPIDSSLLGIPMPRGSCSLFVCSCCGPLLS